MLVCMYVCRPEIVKCQFLFLFFFFNSSLKDNLLSKQRFLTILDGILDGIFYELTFFVFSPGASALFLPFCAFFNFFNCRLGKKQKNVSFYGVCMYVRPKLTFVSFYFCFFAPSPQMSPMSLSLSLSGLKGCSLYVKSQSVSQ